MPKVIDGLLEPRLGVAGAFGEAGSIGWNIVDRPVVPSACRSVGSSQSSARLRAPAGTSVQASGGETSSPSQVNRRGIASPSEKALELSRIVASFGMPGPG
jgi:hypothetical protein